MYITMSETESSPATISLNSQESMASGMWSKDEFLRKASALACASVSELLSQRRHGHLVRVRWACYLVLINRGNTYPQAGSTMKKDHTTIIHGVKKARELMETDVEFRAMVGALT